MTQSIPMQASAVLNGAVGSANNPVKRPAGNKFELFLAGSIKGETKVTVKTKDIKANVKSINDPNKAQPKNDKNRIMVKTQESMATISDSIKVDTQSEQDGYMDEKNPFDMINPELLEQILAMLGQIKNVIMEELELTPEKLDTMMTDLGIELSDLTDPQAMMQLLLANNGSIDPFAVIMDEQLGYSFQSLLTTIKDIKEEANLKLSDDEIIRILEESIAMEKSEALQATDEAEPLQPIISSGQSVQEEVEDSDVIIRLQTDSKDKDIANERPIISAKSDGEFKSNDDSKAKSDKATDGFEAFLDRLSTSYDKPIVEFTPDNVRMYDIREIAQQIIDQIRVSINPEQTTMELQLNPEHLGKVNLTVNSKEGVMTAHFVVQNDLAKEAIEGQLITLKDTLAQQGIKVETIEVTVASYTFDQNNTSDDAEGQMQKKQRSGHKITFEEAVAMSEEPLEETNEIMSGTTGYNINYTA